MYLQCTFNVRSIFKGNKSFKKLVHFRGKAVKNNNKLKFEKMALALYTNYICILYTEDKTGIKLDNDKGRE